MADLNTGALQSQNPATAMVPEAAGKDPLLVQMMQNMLNQQGARSDYLAKQQDAYNQDMQQYADMIAQSRTPEANEANMWGAMAEAASSVAPNYGNLGQMIGKVGGAYGAQQGAMMDRNLKNQGDLTKMRQTELRALEARDQNTAMLRALGGAAKVVAPTIKVVDGKMVAARWDPATQSYDTQELTGNRAQRRLKLKSLYFKSAVAANHPNPEAYSDEQTELELNKLDDMDTSQQPPAAAPTQPARSVAQAAAPQPAAQTTTPSGDPLLKLQELLSPTDMETAKRLFARIQANPSAAERDTATLNALLGKYIGTGAAPVKTANVVGSAGSIAGGTERKLAEELKAKEARDVSEPMPVGAVKEQQELLEAVGNLSQMNGKLDKFSKAIENKTLQLGPVKNIESQGRNYLGMSDSNSRAYADFKASMEKLRNDSLRLNKGVQTEGDAIRAWNELFANINDPGVVSDRLNSIKEYNTEAARQKKESIKVLRDSFKKGPLNTSAYEGEAAAEDPDAEYKAWKAKRGAK